MLGTAAGMGHVDVWYRGKNRSCWAQQQAWVMLMFGTEVRIGHVGHSSRHGSC